MSDQGKTRGSLPALAAWVREHSAGPAAVGMELLERWCKIESGSNHEPGLAAMAAALEASFGELPAVEMRRLWPAGTRASGAPVLSFRKRPRAPFKVLLSGHYDTVYPPGTLFPDPPLADGRFRAPGAADMKGGLAVLRTALEVAEAHPAAAGLGWEVLLTPDEETGSLKSRALIEARGRTADLALVFEPAAPDGSVIRRRMGGGVFVAEVEGRAAHAGRDYAEGRNAVAALARFIAALDELNGARRGVIVNAARIEGGGAANVVPDQARAIINLRVATAAGRRWLERAVERARRRIERERGVEVRWSGSFARPPKEAKAPWGRFFGRLRTCGRALGQRITYIDTGGASDGNLLEAAGLPVLDGMGIGGGELHSAREFALPETLRPRAELTALLLLSLAAEVGSGKMP